MHQSADFVLYPASPLIGAARAVETFDRVIPRTIRPVAWRLTRCVDHDLDDKRRPLDRIQEAAIIVHCGNRRLSRMAPSGMLRAWIEHYSNDKYLAAFIGVAVTSSGEMATARRPPATYICSSPKLGRQWVEGEAAAFGLPVEWVEDPAHS